MSVSRTTVLGALALSGALLLSACASENNSPAPAAGGSGSSGSTGSTDCFSGNLKAEGSSAQKNAIDEAISVFQTKCADATIDYNPSGSGSGIKQFIAKQVDFAGSDSALKTVAVDGLVEADDAAKACGSPAWNLPMVTGPIAVAYNVAGVDKLVLDAEVTAKIFDGKVTTWNDPAIAKLNAGVKLPSTPIKVYFRSDDSGTTENFTKYLKAAAPDAWSYETGKKWTGKGEGKEKSAGVATAVKGQDGGITYVELSYAKQNTLKMAEIDTGSGPVELNAESVGKTVATAKPVGSGNDLALKIDYATKEAGAYPIILVTYEVVCSKYSDAAQGSKVRAFLTTFASDAVQGQLEELGYAPLPTEVATKVQTAVKAIS
ncbi:phosphate ABC transporter substrate-binding protein PstS [Humibacillus sp. DSM 29435]|uniref:phosphate ABC transporter substrate-binding protein PstS n=1 Tax=Humibacillus sp. DSM 29435 TaxID=1869167 RepID=UPI00087230AD|nr:phosphate ABC transporter substrate-binding protein PstS [Humibacillus sp. DSM 29435]OFE15886.1 phosphate ABC transporter substrate-binding protein PstS [Humibacillus sp. DSM 29435]